MISNSDEWYIIINRPNAAAVNNYINLFWGGLLKSMAVRPNPPYSTQISFFMKLNHEKKREFTDMGQTTTCEKPKLTFLGTKCQSVRGIGRPTRLNNLTDWTERHFELRHPDISPYILLYYSTPLKAVPVQKREFCLPKTWVFPFQKREVCPSTSQRSTRGQWNFMNFYPRNSWYLGGKFMNFLVWPQLMYLSIRRFFENNRSIGS